jgi:putative ABC transport system permease protein
MRALGASGRQVVASVAIEAFVVGLFSSIVGLGLGVLVVKPLELLLQAFGIDLPSGPLQILPRTIIVSIVVGTVVTFFSALSPARRAAQVPPIAALRDQATSPSSGRRRYIWGIVLTAIGAVLLALGLFGSGNSAALLVGVSAAVVFIGIAMLSPLIAQPAAKVLTWPAERLKSVTGMLAQQNAIRNPRRTASTAAALMIGLALVTIISIVGESAKATFASAIDNQTKTDFIMAPTNFVPFSPEAATEVRAAFQQKFGSPGSVVEWRSGSASVNGSPTEVLGLTADFRSVSDVPMRGRLDVAALRDGGVIIRDTAADGKTCVPGTNVDAPRVPCRVGRNLPMQFPTSIKAEPVPVAGIYTDDKAVGSNTDYFVGFNPNTDQWQQRFTVALDLFAFIRKPAGASTLEAQQVLDRITKQIGGIDATNKAEFKDRQLAQFNQILGLVYVLLLFAVIIALIGIVNTLALSIYERTREIGLLRAVGMTRAQLRRMVRGEAVIVAVFGSLLGLAIGLVFGVSIVQALSSEGIVFTLPVGQLVAFVVLAGLAGLLAGTPPARRAARLDVLKAVNSE